MVDLKTKLARLGSPGGGPAPKREPLAADEPPAELTEDREQTLESLRQKMRELLGRDAGPKRVRPELDVRDLPFAEVETGTGPLFQRRLTLAASAHVGRMPVSAGADARAEMLALLALDPSLNQIRPQAALYLDTETTGLSGGAGTVAFLVGMAWFDAESRLVVEQLLLRQPGEEQPLLELVAQRVQRSELLVTFNGKAFDLPLLASRYVMNRLPPLEPRPHLDLLHVGRRLHRARLGQCRLVTLESEVLGLVRGEDIDGSEVPQRYSHYLRTGDAEGLRAVVDHNAQDVMSLAALVGLYGEPLGVLHPRDLAALARTLRRARALDQAARAAELAVEQGGGTDALRVRGEISKARGDRLSALADFESLSAEVDDPAVRLELAKLYEHYVKDLHRALNVAEQGTGETDEAWQRRKERLRTRVRRARGRKTSK